MHMVQLARSAAAEVAHKPEVVRKVAAVEVVALVRPPCCHH